MARGGGRTHTARLVADALRDAGRAIEEVAGADGTAGLPLAPFAPLLSSHQLDGPVSSEDPSLALLAYTRLPRLLATPTLATCVVVDDADDLDSASGLLVSRLARAGVPVVLVATDLASLPRSIPDGISAGGWELLEVDPARPDEILALATIRVGGELSAGAAADLLARCDGRPAVAVALLQSAVAEPTPGGVELTWPRSGASGLGRWYLDPALLPADQRRAAEVVAVAGTVPPDAVQQVPGMDQLLSDRALQEDSGAIGFARRLDRDLVLTAMAPTIHRMRAAEALALVTAASVAAGGSETWQARAALMAVRAGTPPPAATIVAAAQWVGLTAPERSELLTTAPDDLAATQLLRGAEASAGGHLETAAMHLDAARALLTVDQTAPDRDGLLVRLAHELGILHAVRRGDAAAAVEAVTSLLRSPMGARTRDLIATELVKWRLMAGETDVAAPDVAIEEVDAAGTVGTAVIGAMIASLDGSRSAAEHEVAIGLQALGRTTVAPASSGHLLELSRFLALVFDGELSTAEEMATSRRDLAGRAAGRELGMWEYAAAELALHTGRLEDAAVLGERAVRHLAWHDFTGLRSTAEALVLAVAARRGQATSEPPDPADEPDVKVALHLARVAATRSGPDVLARTARRALAEMHGHLGVLALDEAWMTSRSPALADELLELASRGGVARILATRAAAHVDGSAQRLSAAATHLETMGLVGRAADCWEQAARLHQEAGRHDTAARGRRTAAVLRSVHLLGSWPESAVILSPREIEIAQLAARRVRSKEIGEQLGLSARTVDNHLAKVYRKLGISGRAELRSALTENSR
ncbi:MAG: LuxR C-terminal-related transcriptional regulator [Propionibacteriales bacterium]|nr:LuxR C-terminal-related transcriptional regulator [Propionibacteriales bacterium]